ncbi:MAG: 3-methyl-2-oxobutanoate hydroxymethyltransferase [Kiritimatiellae bacterium]|jgi:3-methyl-2-oxobutanoate hydroxymethyltransferase|nr:3-methyl-2-oxobutanoate hydroxymethyltransferase [Kiritimatiellia bacterium]
MKRWNTAKIRAAKGTHKIACLTAYDYALAKLADNAGAHLILVGDSLGMTTLGYSTTIPVTMEDMLHHTAAVVRGTQDALVVADMPFLSYQISIEEALRNSGRFLQEAGADAVKIEGGAIREECVAVLTENGIPVLGHIGLLPQSIKTLGTFKVQGKTREAADILIDDAKQLAEAGAFGIVLECVPPDIAALVTAAVPIPVIGIGSGSACDGQILVVNDLLGLSENPPAKFVKQYASLAPQIKEAFTAYINDVQAGEFPAPEHFYATAQIKSSS